MITRQASYQYSPSSASLVCRFWPVNWLYIWSLFIENWKASFQSYFWQEVMMWHNFYSQIVNITSSGLLFSHEIVFNNMIWTIWNIFVLFWWFWPLKWAIHMTQTRKSSFLGGVLLGWLHAPKVRKFVGEFT